jgi:cytochrome c peroxidase
MEGFPSVVHPDNNEYSEERTSLGKLLFYDPILSSDSTISCASCHKQEFAFGDNVSVSKGVDGRLGARNSPSLANVAYHPYFTREGGVPSLEHHVLVPLQEHAEMDLNILIAAERIGKSDRYMKLCESAYPDKPYYFAITSSLAQFQRSFISSNSKFDDYLVNQDPKSLTQSELNGMKLFFSNRTNCSSCHEGINFTNYGFENNGIYKTYLDPGRYRLTKEDADRAKFKIPSLRNVGLTAPYMHDGSMSSLEEVIEMYSKGGRGSPYQSQLIKPLNLTDKEKKDLVEFLKTLTDTEFIQNKEFQIP